MAETLSAPARPVMNPSHPEPGIEVAAGLVFRHGWLLITQRFDQDHLGGLWEFPGGKRQPRETFEQCLQRELMEELGIQVEPRELVEVVEHTYPEKKVLLKFFRCQWLAHEPRAIGCQSFAWVHVQDLAQYSFPAADAKLLARLQKETHLWKSG